MVTILTSVYNRKYIIEQLYNSLKLQTNKNFEWIVIDDGSTDSVFNLLEEWAKSEKDFKIRIFRVNNGGKHRAINKAVKIAKGESFFIVDSDDYISDDAVAFIEEHFPEIHSDDFAGISGLKYSIKSKENIGQKLIFEDFVDATNLERDKYGLLGDKAEVYKTSVLIKYPFPEYEGENFVTEAVVWNRIAYDRLKIRWFNKVIYYCDYLEDGLTNHGQTIFEKNPYGWAKWVSDAEKLGYFKKSVIIKKCINFYLFTFPKIDFDNIISKFFTESKAMTEAIEQIKSNSKNIQKYLFNNKINSFAIYGYGIRGARFCRYLEILKIKPDYVIDKNAKEIDINNVFTLSDNLKKVDAVIITMKNNVLCDNELKTLCNLTSKIVDAKEIVMEF